MGMLRAGSRAARLQRILAMRLLHVASAGLLTVVALLAWVAAEPSVEHAPSSVGSTALAHGVSSVLATSDVAGGSLTSRSARHTARAVARQLLLGRARATDGDGDATLVSLLATPPAPSFGDVAEGARVQLRCFAQRHSPSGEPSPFDATAPPAASRRNG